MRIERATEKDIEGINKLLEQVLEVHHKGRPDIFKSNSKKYEEKELIEIIKDESSPIFLYKNEENEVLGHAFCIFQEHKEHNVLKDIRTLYIDDICVEENSRGQRIGKALYDYIVDFARKNKCYNITLNVWAFNEEALRFYEKCGLKAQKIGMEVIL